MKCSIINSLNALLSKKVSTAVHIDRDVGMCPEMKKKMYVVAHEIKSDAGLKLISYASPVLRSLERTMWPLLQN